MNWEYVLYVVLLTLAAFALWHTYKHVHRLYLSIRDIFLHKEVQDEVLHVTNRHKSRWWHWRRKDFSKKRAYVFDFSTTNDSIPYQGLEKEVGTILDLAKPGTIAVLRISSPGGDVDGYRMCAVQLRRILNAGIPLTVCIDHVAASGGYFLAVMADRIVASSAAEVGSIGVIDSLTSVLPLCRIFGIEVLVLTAGTHKLRDNPFSELDEDRKRITRERIDKMHRQFKEHIVRYRGDKVCIEDVSNGEVWLGEEALQKGLIDEVASSDEELRRLEGNGYMLRHIRCVHPKSLPQKPDMQDILIDEAAKFLKQLVKRLQG